MGWSQLRGHERVVGHFQRAHAAGRLAHAYILAGPPGVGKRLFGRLLAQALLCENAPGSLEGCGECPACRQVMAGTHPDFLMVNKPEDKVEFPIGTMRDFITQLGLKASRGPRKVAIVEDAETFNEESANAFLKTLEEPPPGCLLLLRTTALETQLPTIRSRCQPVLFHPLSREVVTELLRQRADITPERVATLAAAAQGSIGRAIALHDDAFWEFRTMLMEALVATRWNGGLVAERWLAFVEAAGKESSAQRARASLTIELAIDFLRQASMAALGGTADAPATTLARRVGVDALLEMLNACLDASLHVERRAPVALIIDSLVDRLAAAIPAAKS